MEDDDIETSSGGGLIPIALAILAIVLGGAGLYFGLTANQRLSPLAESMDAGSSSTARLEKEISGFETKVAELSAQYSELEKALGRIRLYSNQSEQTVKTVASNVKENRDQIVKLAGRLNELVSSGSKPASTAPTTVASSTATPETAAAPSTTEASSEGTYTIVSGDTFGKIANKLDVGLQALLDANPDADPRRLPIGQAIKVPTD